MKKTIVTVAVIVVALITIILIRALVISPSRHRIIHKPAEKVECPMVAQHLSEAIRFRTVSLPGGTDKSGGELLRFHGFLEKAFPKVHAELKKEVIGGHSLLYEWKGRGEGKRPILLMGHLDVVPVEQGNAKTWVHAPFSGVIADGFVWGRGALDDKGSVISILQAVEILLGRGFKPDRTIFFAFGHDEEIGGEKGAKKIARYLKERKIRLEYVLDEGSNINVDLVSQIKAPIAFISIAEKGYLSVELSTEGEEGHSSTPPRMTAAGVIARAVARLQDRQFNERLTEVPLSMFRHLAAEMPFGNRIMLNNLWLFGGLLKKNLSGSPVDAAMLHTTIAPTMLSGSLKDNVLPARSTAVVNLRIIPGESMAGTIDHIKKAIDDPRVAIRILDGASEPSGVSSIDSEGYAALQNAIWATFPGVVTVPCLMTATTDSRHYGAISDDIYRFAPYWMKPGDGKRIHGVNERITVANLQQCVNFYINFIAGTAAGAGKAPAVR